MPSSLTFLGPWVLPCAPLLESLLCRLLWDCSSVRVPCHDASPASTSLQLGIQITQCIESSEIETSLRQLSEKPEWSRYKNKKPEGYLPLFTFHPVGENRNRVNSSPMCYTTPSEVGGKVFAWLSPPAVIWSPKTLWVLVRIFIWCFSGADEDMEFPRVPQS